MRLLLLLALSLSLLLTTCGQGDFEKHQAGTVTLWLTDSQLTAESECRKRGVDVPGKVHGCCDFPTATIISTKDFRVLSHELCHWTLATYSHDKCPTPLL